MNKLSGAVSVSILAGAILGAAGPVAAEDSPWKWPDKIRVVEIGKKATALALAAAEKDGKLPKDGRALEELYVKDTGKPLPAVLPGGHTRTATGIATSKDAGRVVLREEASGEVTWTLTPKAVKDSGGWVYLTGKFKPASGAARPFWILYLDCNHDEEMTTTYPVGAIMASPASCGKVRATAIFASARYEAEHKIPTESDLNSVRSAISIYYGDQEGVYPPTLDDLVPIFMTAVPGRASLTYDPKTGRVEAIPAAPKP